jgi:uncharacterized membrane protein YjfL (UPF0719 family)
MGDDEVLAMGVAGAFALFTLWPFYRALAGSSALYRNAHEVRLLGFAPPVALAPLLVVLVKFADPVVRGSVGYILLFVLAGAAVSALTLRLLPVFGLSWRDDVVETRNPAATTAVCGALFGVSLVFSGSNIGDGPTIWTTLGPATLALGIFFAAWWTLERVSHPSEAVALDRDAAAGARLAGFFVAAGAILGHAAAGDWVSTADAASGLVRGAAAVLVLVGVAALADRKMRPTPEAPEPDALSSGVLYAGAYLLASGAWVWASLAIR